MEVTALSLCKSVLSQALSYSKSAVAEEVALQLGIQRDQAFIRDELEMMESFLMFANEAVDKNRMIKTWVRQVRDASYDVEDSLQDFAVRLEGSMSWWYIPWMLFDRHHVAKQMKELRGRVEDISQRNVRYNLMNELASKGSQHGKDLTQSGFGSVVATFSSSVPAMRSRLTLIESKAAEFQLIGRDKEKHHIVKQISNEDTQQLDVISICGMGGVGKTTLVKDIYQSQVLTDMYKTRACVTIVRPFDSTEILRSIFMQLDPHESGNLDVDSIASKIASLLEGKKYLIVLDDLSSTVEWDAIIQHLPTLETASRIIITTRLENIARHCSRRQENICNLRTLGSKDACDLFTEKVFGKITDLDKQYPELVEESKMILKKCDGLPLAIVTIGGFLGNQPKTLMVWRKLNDHISAELELNPEIGMIRTVLVKSYDGLPYHLKSCFLYLSIFPEDHSISRKRLVRRWTAEGYSSELRGKSAEEISDSFFVELIDRSMILPLQVTFDITKGVNSCQLHDLMREISISKAMEENLVFRMEDRCILNTPGITRHLVICRNWEGDQHEFESTVDLTRIRSLTVFGKWRWYFLSNKMRFLRVLDLEGTLGIVDHHLEHIGRFKHLRYLSLKGCSGIFHLPDSLGELRQLETLNIRGTEIIMLPKTITKCRRLRHIDARGVHGYAHEQRCDDKCLNFQDIGAEFFTSCCSPQIYGADDLNRRDIFTQALYVKIPGTIMDLDRSGVMVPQGIGQLKTLQTLRVVHLAWGTSILHDIEGLTQLRKLGVVGINKRNGPGFCSSISNLGRLESLSVDAKWGPDLYECFAGNFYPPENLQSLKIEGVLVQMPVGVGNLQHLVKLKLRNTRLFDADPAMHVIGSLPKLSLLRLWWSSFQAAELHFKAGDFRELIMVEFAEKWGVEKITFDDGTMPKLNLLSIKNYTGMEVVCFSGIDLLPSMKEVCLSANIEPRKFYPVEVDRNRAENVGNLEESLRIQVSRNSNQPTLKLKF